MKQGLDQRDNRSFEDWLSVAIIEAKIRNPKVAEELETGEYLERPPEPARTACRSTKRHLRGTEAPKKAPEVGKPDSRHRGRSSRVMRLSLQVPLPRPAQARQSSLPQD